jgi:excisionase family DNA binding protein
MSLPPSSDDRFALPLNEFCRRVGISRTLAYRLAAKGELRLVKLGTRTIVPVSEVRRLLGSEPGAPLPLAA